METLVILLSMFYFICIIFAEWTMSVIFSFEGIWYNRLEHPWKTRLIVLLPIVNFVYPVYLRIKGIRRKI